MAVVLLALRQSGRPVGVVESAFFRSWSAEAGDLLLSVRETLPSAIEGAVSHRATIELLARTQKQAEQLSTQEEELRSMNEELRVQQEELQHSNAELRPGASIGANDEESQALETAQAARV